MIVSHCITNTYCNKLTKNREKNNVCIEKISSGKRINKAADDAAGCTISESMRAQVRGLSQAERNIQDAVSMLQVADGALGEITNQLIRMKELSVKAANGILTEDDRNKVNEEFIELKNGIEEIAKNTEFNNISLFNEDKTLTMQVKQNPFGSYEINLKKLDANIMGIEGTSLSSVEKSSEAIKNVDSAILTVVMQRTDLGTHANNLQHNLNDNRNYNENITASLSGIEDINMATAYMNYIKGSVITQYNEVMYQSSKHNVETVGKLLF